MNSVLNSEIQYNCSPINSIFVFQIVHPNGGEFYSKIKRLELRNPRCGWSKMSNFFLKSYDFRKISYLTKVLKGP